MLLLVANLSGPIRRATLHGRPHLVAPVVMMRAGVLQGSKGSLYYPADEIDRSPEVWNGIPIVVRHPERNGVHLSARDPDVAAAQQVGTIYRAQASGGKLTAEAWIDVKAAKRVDPRVLTAIESGQHMEVSTGLHFDREEPAPQGAVHNGVPYRATVRGFRPDHLALLPDQIGACDRTAGCGLNVNRSDPMTTWPPTAEQLRWLAAPLPATPSANQLVLNQNAEDQEDVRGMTTPRMDWSRPQKEQHQEEQEEPATNRVQTEEDADVLGMTPPNMFR